MALNFSIKISKELNITSKQVQSVINLLDEGSTIPFISRYRKEMTGGLDEVIIENIKNRNEQLIELEKRREFILKTISEQGKLSPELQNEIESAETISRLEDIYLPYKPKRKTKASIAKEKGLEPLAHLLIEQGNSDPFKEANRYINIDLGVLTEEDALAGARDIVAEIISEDASLRGELRDFYIKTSIITSKLIKGKEKEAEKYKDYFDWTEPLKSVPSHRLLAIRRGEKELFLNLDISPDEEEAERIISKYYLKGNSKSSDQIKKCIFDSYKRLLKPSLETDCRIASKLSADEEAIRVFRENLRELLLAAPLGQKNIMAIDPGFRTGCKVVCLNKQGAFLEYENIFPTQNETKARVTLEMLAKKFDIEAIAIGNGTASRETEEFVKKSNFGELKPLIVMVNESGASIYSASEVARDEFPDKDVTVRGAISIGRRLLDPLAELVKIDPKSIGVGQYQHDVDQVKLKLSLDNEVISCVNSVGVEINTASKQLLTYVSGLGPVLAQNIVEYRNENGPFKSRSELKKVPRLGDKAFEQSAGFLRIQNAKNPLDSSAVHPESYYVIEKMSKDLNCNVTDLISKSELRKLIQPKNYVSETIGLPTIQDIIQELAKPGRDPREQFEAFSFTSGVEKIDDLKVGMELPGIVTNVANFGAFVDIGVHQDGLVHISQLSDTFISDPRNVVKVGQKVKVRVTEIDIQRKRIALTMKSQTSVSPKAKIVKETDSGDMSDKLKQLKSLFK
ncbi:MAG: RNA-binding transcriptional accessory protein [Opitutaceae bacterium]|nr:RNA-binding transcriptional accessory protein [Cytophagales bacterium]